MTVLLEYIDYFYFNNFVTGHAKNLGRQDIKFKAVKAVARSSLLVKPGLTPSTTNAWVAANHFSNLLLKFCTIKYLL